MNKIFLTIFLTATFNLFYAGEGLQINQDVYPFEDKATEQLFYSLLFELRCPKCQSSNLSGSNSPISNDLKREVYELVIEGKSGQEIKKHLIDRYGNFIVYNPPVEPATYILWYGPLSLAFISLVILIYKLRRQKRK